MSESKIMAKEILQEARETVVELSAETGVSWWESMRTAAIVIALGHLEDTIRAATDRLVAAIEDGPKR